MLKQFTMLIILAFTGLSTHDISHPDGQNTLAKNLRGRV